MRKPDSNKFYYMYLKAYALARGEGSVTESFFNENPCDADSLLAVAIAVEHAKGDLDVYSKDAVWDQMMELFGEDEEEEATTEAST